MTLSVRSVKRSLLATVIAAGVCAPPAGAATLGGLTQLGGTSSCVTGDGSLGPSGGVCTAAPEMVEANSMLISPDGKFAYVNGFRSPTWNILTFSRDPVDRRPGSALRQGLLPQPGRLGQRRPRLLHRRAGNQLLQRGRLARHDQGRRVPVRRRLEHVGRGGVQARLRDRQADPARRHRRMRERQDGDDEDDAATCADGRVLNVVRTRSRLSSDERFAYVTSNDFAGVAGVAIFARDTTTGRLTQLRGHRWLRDLRRRERGRRGHVPEPARRRIRELVRDHAGRQARLPAPLRREQRRDPRHRPARPGRSRSRRGTAGCISMDGLERGRRRHVSGHRRPQRAWHAAVSPDGQTDAHVRPSPTAWTRDGDLPHRCGDRRADAPGRHGPLHLQRRQQRRRCRHLPGRPRPGTPRGDDHERGRPVAVRHELSRSTTDAGVTVFAVDPATGKLTQHAGKDGCFTQDGSSLDGADTCTDINSEGGSYKLALSPDQAFAYLPSAGRRPRSRLDHGVLAPGAAGLHQRDRRGGVPDAVRAGAAVQRSQR